MAHLPAGPTDAPHLTTGADPSQLHAGGPTSTNPSTFGTPSTTSAPGPAGPTTFGDPSSVPSADPSTAPSTFGGPGTTTVDPSTAPSTFGPPTTTDTPAVGPSTGPSTFGPPDGTTPTAPATTPATFGPPSGTTGTPAVPTGPSTFTLPDPTTTTPTGPSTFGPGVPGGDPTAPTTATPAGAPVATPAPGATSSTLTPQSSPWFLDVLHFFQFITLTGQLQLDYPSFFASFTRLFKFSTGSLSLGFVSAAAASWLKVSTVTVLTTTPVATNDTVPSVADVTSNQDVGLTAFIYQFNLLPAAYFPTTLITLLLVAAVIGVVSLFLTVLIDIISKAVKKSKKIKSEESNLLLSEEKIELKERQVLIRFVLANLVRTWMIAQYPLTAASLYWLSHFSTSSLAPASVTAVASIVFAIFCVLVPLYLVYLIFSNPVEDLFSSKALLETIGPLYDHVKPSKLYFAATQIGYYGLQGLIVGGFPRNSTRNQTDTAGSRQWVQALCQTLLLLILEIAMLVVVVREDPLADLFSGRLLVIMSWSKLLVLVMICGFAIPEYRKSSVGADGVLKYNDLDSADLGSGIPLLRSIMGYLAALIFTILVLSLLTLMGRKVYLLIRAFLASRKGAAAGKDNTPEPAMATPWGVVSEGEEKRGTFFVVSATDDSRWSHGTLGSSPESTSAEGSTQAGTLLRST
ncbi:hypothetical protein DFJ73DRAFT_262655 [Zopfochytrium polystomum]|nr:hypothetical protein DFJ73DRAFT_262655 [Zopfochytrium polystomum]